MDTLDRNGGNMPNAPDARPQDACPLTRALLAEVQDLQTSAAYLAELLPEDLADVRSRAQLLLDLGEINVKLASWADTLGGLLDDHEDTAEALDAAGPADVEQLRGVVRSLARRVAGQAEVLARRAEVPGNGPSASPGVPGSPG